MNVCVAFSCYPQREVAAVSLSFVRGGGNRASSCAAQGQTSVQEPAAEFISFLPPVKLWLSGVAYIQYNIYMDVCVQYMAYTILYTVQYKLEETIHSTSPILLRFETRAWVAYAWLGQYSVSLSIFEQISFALSLKRSQIT